MVESLTERMRRLGFSREGRQKWIAENKGEILAYCSLNGRTATMKQYHVGASAMQRLLKEAKETKILIPSGPVEKTWEGKPRVESGKSRRLGRKKLAPLRKLFYDEYEKNPKISCEKFAELHGAARTTVFGWRRKERTIVETAPKAVPKEGITSASIADALLVKVVEALKRHDELVSRINTVSGNLRICREEVLELKDALKKADEEKMRLLKIHNGQVERGNLTSVEELKRLASAF